MEFTHFSRSRLPVAGSCGCTERKKRGMWLRALFSLKTCPRHLSGFLRWGVHTKGLAWRANTKKRAPASLAADLWPLGRSQSSAVFFSLVMFFRWSYFFCVDCWCGPALTQRRGAAVRAKTGTPWRRATLFFPPIVCGCSFLSVESATMPPGFCRHTKGLLLEGGRRNKQEGPARQTNPVCKSVPAVHTCT